MAPKISTNHELVKLLQQDRFPTPIDPNVFRRCIQALGTERGILMFAIPTKTLHKTKQQERYEEESMTSVIIPKEDSWIKVEYKQLSLAQRKLCTELDLGLPMQQQSQRPAGINLLSLTTGGVIKFSQEAINDIRRIQRREYAHSRRQLRES
jgi:hypothetical protein